MIRNWRYIDRISRLRTIHENFGKIWDVLSSSEVSCCSMNTLIILWRINPIELEDLLCQSTCKWPKFSIFSCTKICNHCIPSWYLLLPQRPIPTKYPDVYCNVELKLELVQFTGQRCKKNITFLGIRRKSYAFCFLNLVIKRQICNHCIPSWYLLLPQRPTPTKHPDVPCNVHS